MSYEILKLRLKTKSMNELQPRTTVKKNEVVPAVQSAISRLPPEDATCWYKICAQQEYNVSPFKLRFVVPIKRKADHDTVRVLTRKGKQIIERI